MKKYFPKISAAFLIMIWVFTYIMGNSFAAVNEDEKTSDEKSSASPVMLKNILLAKLPGKERIHLVVSRQPLIDVKNKDNGSYLIRLEDTDVPESLCRPLGEGELNNIISVVPSKQLVKGKSLVYLTIYPHEAVPYSIRQEGENVLIDFNVAGLEEKKANDSRKASVSKKALAKVKIGRASCRERV